MGSRGAVPGPLALVMGDVDLVRALGVAGIDSAFFGFPDDAARFSRHVRVSLPWIDQWERQDAVVEELLAFAQAVGHAPVLFAQTDATLLLASRNRDRLGQRFRLLLADAALIDQLVDKGAFQALAARHDLPVPAAQSLRPLPGRPPVREVPFPVVIKPFTRTPGWTGLAGSSKALHVAGPDELAALWPRLVELGGRLLVQELVPGPETRIESFHAYVDRSGAIAGEFTGRKIRTFPARHGQSTAVEITPLADVAELGRDVLARIGLRGVAKLDFKRDDRGRLHLLEVNPRFNLWHHPGALAGVNLPAIVYADLTGRPRPPVAPVPRHVTWCDLPADARAARADGISPTAWLRWVGGCQALCGLAWDDPLPFIRGRLWPAVRRRAARATRRGPRGPHGPPGRSA